jgi:dehydrogenase/reductase SDR family protein 1
MPGRIHGIGCDHTQDRQADAVFRDVAAASGGLDVLVNCAWGGYQRMVEDGNFTWPLPFWEQPDHRWNSMVEAGVRAAFICCSRAAKMMIPRGRGLIVHISFWAAQKYVGNGIYRIAKAATEMTADMARELRPHGVTIVSFILGWFAAKP